MRQAKPRQQSSLMLLARGGLHQQLLPCSYMLAHLPRQGIPHILGPVYRTSPGSDGDRTSQFPTHESIAKRTDLRAFMYDSTDRAPTVHNNIRAAGTFAYSS